MKTILLAPFDELYGAMQQAAGFVNYRWRGLQIMRMNAIPRNPNSVDQIAVRSLMAQAAIGYQAITVPNKVLWTAYTAAHLAEWRTKKYQLPEISSYVQINWRRLLDAAALSPTPPVALCDFLASNIATVAYNGGTTVLTFIVTHNAAVTTGKKWICKITGSLPSAGYSPKKGDYRLCMGATADSVINVSASPQTFTITAPKFGNWVNADLMAIEVLPLSADFDPGTIYSKVNAITVS